MSFYYFVASLPALSLGAPLTASLAAFRAEAARLLPAETVTELDALLAADRAATRSAFADQWFNAAIQLRNAMANIRAARRGVEAAPHLRPHQGFSAYLEQAVMEAYAKGNPLERELQLDRFRWSLLDDLSRVAPFGEETVLAYGLKLQMVERWAALSDEAGQAALLQAVQQVRDRAKQPVSIER